MRMESKDWVTSALAAIAIVISVLAWRAAYKNAKAAEASAQAAVETYELTKRQYEEQREKESSLWNANRKEYCQRLLETAKQIHVAVLGKYSMEFPNQQLIIDFESIHRVPKEAILSQQELIEYFNEEEREKIKRAWSSFQYLLREYSEDLERKGIGYAGTVIGEFNALIRMLEKL